jgi:hypothetical protein
VTLPKSKVSCATTLQGHVVLIKKEEGKLADEKAQRIFKYQILEEKRAVFRRGYSIVCYE